jgi:KTSC domain
MPEYAPEGEWVSLDSSCLAAAMWDGVSSTLLLRFRSGRVYPYQDVDYDIWNDLYNADSHGRFYNQRIKGQFR